MEQANDKQVNQAKTLSLEDLTVSQEEFAEQKIKFSDLYILVIEGEEKGPFLGKKLLEFLGVNQKYYSNKIMVRSLKEESWRPLTDHPFFQRRKLTIVNDPSATTSESNEYYIMMDGRKKGPFDSAQINEKIQAKDILYTDLISNNGETWCKILEISEFDRRTNDSSESLPILPGTNVFGKSKLEAVKSVQDDPGEHDALISLATYGRSIGEKNNSKNGTQTNGDEFIPYNQFSIIKSTGIVFVLIVTAAIIYFMTEVKLPTTDSKVTADSKGPTTTGTQTSIQKSNKLEPAKLKPVKRFRKTTRSSRSSRSSRSLTKRSRTRSPSKRTPFRKSSRTSRKRLSDSPTVRRDRYEDDLVGEESQDDEFFDDPDTPIELEPESAFSTNKRTRRRTRKLGDLDEIADELEGYIDGDDEFDKEASSDFEGEEEEFSGRGEEEEEEFEEERF